MYTFLNFVCYVVVIRFPHGFSMEGVLTRRHIVLNPFNLSTALAPLSFSCCFFVSRSYPPSVWWKADREGPLKIRLSCFHAWLMFKLLSWRRWDWWSILQSATRGHLHCFGFMCVFFKLFLHCNCNTILSVLLSAHQSLYLDTSAKRTCFSLHLCSWQDNRVAKQKKGRFKNPFGWIFPETDNWCEDREMFKCMLIIYVFPLVC